VAIRKLNDMMGKVLLVGVTYVDADDEVVEQLQVAGRVISVDPLVTIERTGAEPFTLPPDRQAFDRGAPGEYHLRATGEVVVDPDFVSTWVVAAPEN
jgi:hypothetical protein